MTTLGSPSTGIEQRKSTRSSVDVQVTCRAQGSEIVNKALAKNLSEEGVGLFLPEPISPGTCLDLELFILNGTGPFRVLGEVIWQSAILERPLKDSIFTGVRFLKMAPDHRNLLKGFLTSTCQVQPKTERWRFPHKKFVCYKQITLKQTNMEGNTYFDNYLTWHGDAREALLLSHPNIETFLKNERHVKMITHSLYQKFIQDSFFGDVIRIEVTSTKVKHCSFVFIYRFYNSRNNNLIGEGWQKICFAHFETGKLILIPQVILDLIEPLKEEKAKGDLLNPRC